MNIRVNIKEAKQEVINTVRAYLKKDDTGAYEIPPERQRPILLMGPPGIGKTAIMEQVARECGISLVSYTITHHTRQSAIGLPYISQKEYGGEEHAVTEYTMSEIVASVYDQIEASGISEGILFLDEINCVSETLAPTMLQFLQYKMFGNHKVPEGFLIVTAGNPPQYNKSVRDFDIVTLDRVKRIDIEEDFPAFKEYAYQAGIHGAVLSYLEIRKKDFYSVKTQIDGRQFVTARGWEDLSRIIKVYEELGIEVTERLCVQYLQDPEIAAAFASYYELYSKYRALYRIPEILEGTIPEESAALREAPFDEKLSILGLLIDSLNQEFQAYAEEKRVQERVLEELGRVRAALKREADADPALPEHGARYLLTGRRLFCEEEIERRRKARMLDRAGERVERKVCMRLAGMEKILAVGAKGDARYDFSLLKQTFDLSEKKRQEEIREADRHLTNSFRFLSATFGEGQEIVLFLSELTAGYYSLKFVNECGNDAFYRYNRLLLLKDREESLQREAMELLEM